MDWRRTLILLITVGLLSGAFVLYRHFLVEDIDLGPDPNLVMEETSLYSEAGQIAADGTKVDLRVANDVTFQTRVDGEVIREFGWKKKVTYSRDNYWEMGEPFIRIFRPNMAIEVTAHYGKMQTDSVAGETKLQDATFTGEVCLHVTPTEDSKVEECWVYMDEMVFIRDRSEFSGQGEVLFRSRSLTMEGHNLHFIYSRLEQKVQFFRLEDLDRMVIRVPDTALFFRDQAPVPMPGGQAMVVSDPNDEEHLSQALVAALAGQLYRCRLHRNVMLQTPKQAVYSSEGVVLTHILWPKGAMERWQQDDPNDPNVLDAIVGGQDTNIPEDANDSITELTMTCDGGVTIVPEGMEWPKDDFLDDPFDEHQARAAALAQLSKDQSWFAARKITHHVFQQHAVAEGPVELTFYSPDLMDPNNATVLVPVKIVAQEKAEYDPNANDIVFTGDCQCTLIRTDPNLIERYSLSAERLTACMAEDKDQEVIAASRNVESLLADGNDVVLRVLTADSNQVVGQQIAPEAVKVGAEMECVSCSYHPNAEYEVFTAMGPGIIRLNNSQGMKSSDPNRAQEPFYAFLRNYEVLQFYFFQDDPNLSNTPFAALAQGPEFQQSLQQPEYMIVADAQERIMELVYIPTTEDGELLPEITAQADHVMMILARSVQGELEPKYLLATGNVFYRDVNHELSAYGLSYDYHTGQVCMWSDLKQVCYADGIPVPGIEMNIKTGDLKLDIVGPSALPLGQ